MVQLEAPWAWSLFGKSLRLLHNLRENIALAHDLDFLPVDLDVVAGVAAVQNLVALADVERVTLAVVVHLARADREDAATLRLLLGGVRQQDATGGLRFGFERLDHHTVVQRPHVEFCFLRHVESSLENSLCE